MADCPRPSIALHCRNGLKHQSFHLLYGRCEHNIWSLVHKNPLICPRCPLASVPLKTQSKTKLYLISFDVWQRSVHLSNSCETVKYKCFISSFSLFHFTNILYRVTNCITLKKSMYFELLNLAQERFS